MMSKTVDQRSPKKSVVLHSFQMKISYTAVQMPYTEFSSCMFRKSRFNVKLHVVKISRRLTVPSSLTIGIEMVAETSVIFKQVTWLIA